MAKQLYKKGESGNPAGRKKGSKNRSTEEIRTFLQAIVNNNLSRRRTKVGAGLRPVSALLLLL